MIIDINTNINNRAGGEEGSEEKSREAEDMEDHNGMGKG